MVNVLGQVSLTQMHTVAFTLRHTKALLFRPSLTLLPQLCPQSTCLACSRLEANYRKEWKKGEGKEGNSLISLGQGSVTDITQTSIKECWQITMIQQSNWSDLWDVCEAFSNIIYFFNLAYHAFKISTRSLQFLWSPTLEKQIYCLSTYTRTWAKADLIRIISNLRVRQNYMPPAFYSNLVGFCVNHIRKKYH